MPHSQIENIEKLLTRISCGEELAFRELFNGYRSKLFTYVLKLTESSELAEDTVHDVFLKLWINRQQLSHIENINSYLFRMAHNMVTNGLKRMAKETLILAELEKGTALEASDPDEKLIRKEVRKFIHEATEKLTPQQKAVFRMSREDGLKQQEIALQLNISIFTVKKHLTDANIFLRKEIIKFYGNTAMAICVIYSLSF